MSSLIRHDTFFFEQIHEMPTNRAFENVNVLIMDFFFIQEEQQQNCQHNSNIKKTFIKTQSTRQNRSATNWMDTFVGGQCRNHVLTWFLSKFCIFRIECTSLKQESGEIKRLSENELDKLSVEKFGRKSWVTTIIADFNVSNTFLFYV